MTLTTASEPESSSPALMTTVDLRSPSDAELLAFLPWFVPSHAHFGDLTYTLALRELLAERGMALTYCARKAALEARQRLRTLQSGT